MKGPVIHELVKRRISTTLDATDEREPSNGAKKKKITNQKSTTAATNAERTTGARQQKKTKQKKTPEQPDRVTHTHTHTHTQKKSVVSDRQALQWRAFHGRLVKRTPVTVATDRLIALDHRRLSNFIVAGTKKKRKGNQQQIPSPPLSAYLRRPLCFIAFLRLRFTALGLPRNATKYKRPIDRRIFFFSSTTLSPTRHSHPFIPLDGHTRPVRTPRFELIETQPDRDVKIKHKTKNRPGQN